MKLTLLRRLTLVLGLFAILGVLAVACGDDEEEKTPTPAAHTPAATTHATSPTPAASLTPAATTHAASPTSAATGAAAGSLTGDWTITVTITKSPYQTVGSTVPCTASLTQTDSSVSGTMPCKGANPLEYKITGSVKAGKFTLTGKAHMAATNMDIEVELKGTISTDGNSISGTYVVSAYQTEATIDGTRD